MFKIPRSFRIIRFLNQKHALPVCFFFSISSFIIVALATLKLSFAKHVFNIFRKDEFKDAGRLAGWYIRNGWTKYDISFDPFFDFTHLSSDKLLKKQSHFLKKPDIQDNGANALYYGYQASILAESAHRSLENEDIELFKKYQKEYNRKINHLLKLLNKPQSQNSRKSLESEAEEGNEFIHKAPETLSDFQKVVPKEDWNWFVTGGTFLGAVREGFFLKHDVDIDVGVHLDGLDLDQFLVKIQNNSSLFSIAKFDMQSEIQKSPKGKLYLNKEPSLLKLIHKNGINLDVFFHKNRNGECWHGSGSMHWVNTSFELKSYSIGKQEVFGPSEADLYLTEHYGEWRVEKKKFSCSSDTTNLTFVRNLHTICFLIRRLIMLYQTDIQAYESLYNQLRLQKLIYQVDGLTCLNKVIIS